MPKTAVTYKGVGYLDGLNHWISFKCGRCLIFIDKFRSCNRPTIITYSIASHHHKEHTALYQIFLNQLSHYRLGL